jgi:hypothetical protein
MAITVKHLKVSTVPDAGDDTLVEPSDWNADHQLTGTVPVENGGTGAATLTGYVKGNGTAAMTAAATIPSTDVTGLGTMAAQNSNNVAITGGTMSGVAITGYIPTTEKAQPLGVATLDAAGKVPTSQIPMQGDLNYQGTWNASTNTPTLTSSVGTKGYYYVVDVAGSTNLNGITDWQVGDWAIFNGSIWQKVDNTDAVTSVNGQTGTVVLTTTNIAEGTNLYYTDVRARAAISAGTGISYDNTTGVVTNAAPDQTVAIAGGTGISTSGTYPSFTVTNTAPDQTVVLNAGTGISVTGTYPNFTVANTSPSLGGDVVGPASATDNAIARFDTTTGKLLQNSVVLVGDTGVVTGVTELTASTKVVSPHFDAQNSAGGQLRNASGTAQIQWGGGGGNNISVDVAININPANAQVDLSPTGTGTVRIAPATAGTMNNMVIGGTTPLAITGTTITANTQFTGAGTGLTGTAASLSIGGNAATVTNGVVTTGSYADPTWITSLAGSKITGTIDGGTF